MSGDNYVRTWDIRKTRIFAKVLGHSGTKGTLIAGAGGIGDSQSAP